DVRTALVFVRTKHGADAVVRRLAKDNIDAIAIHGNKSQAQRERALDAFRDGRVPVLVATDIAARGIHIDALTHVVNFDLPDVPEQYVHRIGRTARAGASGIAVSFVSRAERPQLRDIEKLTGLKLAPRGTAEEEAGSPDTRRQGRQGQGRGQGQRQGQPSGPSSGKAHRKGPPTPRTGEAPRERSAGSQPRTGAGNANGNGAGNSGRR
ncbi:MAG: helicase-related protein, partial [Sphingomonadaceae bacterium]